MNSLSAVPSPVGPPSPKRRLIASTKPDISSNPNRSYRTSGQPAVGLRQSLAVLGQLRRSSPTPLKVHKPWNWHGPESRQFLATEVSRDFIPPCPGGFLPHRRQLLDQPPKPMRNPSHQLNAKSWSKGHARRGDRPGKGLLPGRFAAAQSAMVWPSA